MLPLLATNLLNIHVWHWFAFAGLVVALLTLDLVVFHRRVRTPTFTESAAWSVFWIGLALVFNGFIWWWGTTQEGGADAGITFLTGYLVEKSLSVDNLFVFVVIFRFFAVPLKYQYRVLFWGVLGAIFLRLTFILAGISLIESFEWLLLVFGAFLVYTAVKLTTHSSAEVNPDKNFLLRTARRFFRVAQEDHGQQFFARENGLLCITPLLLVLLVVESTDVLFAVDSVPAIIGITRDPFIVFTSNIFAILGLRALYFLLAGVLDRFGYLHYGLSAVLGFIGIKMMAEFAAKRWGGYHGGHLVPTWVSLSVIGLLLLASVVASMVLTNRAETPVEPCETE